MPKTLSNGPNLPQDATEALQAVLGAPLACRRCHGPRSTQEWCYGSICEDCWALWQHKVHGFSRPVLFNRIPAGFRAALRD